MIYWLMPLIWFVLVVGSGAILVFTRPRQRPPRPDYGRIAELERELGIGVVDVSWLAAEFERKLTGR